MPTVTFKISNILKPFILSSILVLYINTVCSLEKPYPEKATIDHQKITNKINEALARLEVVQGLSVAIYSPHTSYSRGFGVTDRQTQQKVSTNSAFYIASSTKSMFAFLLALKHEQGELNLDQSLADFAPDAPFPKHINTHEITLRNLLAMSSGIKHPAYVHRTAYSGEHDQALLWELINKTKANQSKKIKLGSFRYTNWNYNLLSRLLEYNTEQTWQALLQQEVFDKAGMTGTTAYVSVAKKEAWSIARPHVTLGNDAPLRTYLEKTDKTMHSAGGVYMNAHDALTWLSIFVNDGLVNGEQLFDAQAVQATRKNYTQANTSFGKYQRDYYGLGWYIGPYLRDDIKLVHHFGGFPGARAHVSYMPEEKIGVAIFVNDSQVGGKLIDIIANYVYDSFLNYELAGQTFETELQALIEWKQDINAQLTDLRQKISERKWTLEKPLNKYAGRYVHEGFGTINVKVEGDTLRITNGNLNALAAPGTQSNSVRVEFLPMEGEEILFKMAWFGAGVKSIEYDGVVFERVKG